MFTGIVERTAEVAQIVTEGSNLNITIESDLSHELKIDQSVAHNGICLTVTGITGTQYIVTAVAETIAKTNIGSWHAGDLINLERALRAGDRMDGHFVQGHVDTTATCTACHALEGSWHYRFMFPEAFAALVIEKGSICINGVSLTLFDVGYNEFTVTIIPYTYAHTNFRQIAEGTIVNIEFDVIGKYNLRMQEVKSLKYTS